MIFLSHIEERSAHPVEGLTGLEIYNRHWDSKRDLASSPDCSFGGWTAAGAGGVWAVIGRFSFSIGP